MTTADRLPVLIALWVAIFGIGLIAGVGFGWAFALGVGVGLAMPTVVRWMERS